MHCRRPRCARSASRIANALSAAHAAKILHRDVKPANILAAGPLRWKLADFGVAHVPDSSLTMTGQFVGSPAYAPPEALVRGQSGPEGDVFGLGATLYQAAAGSWPRAEATMGGLLAAVAPLRTLAPHLPADLAAAIDRAVAIEPVDRPTAADLAELLAGTASTPGVVVTPVVPAPPIRPPIRWKPWGVGAGIIGLLVVIALATGDGKSRTATTLTTPASVATPPAPTPAANGPVRIQTQPPDLTDPEAIEAWNEIASRVNAGDFATARDQLEEFERDFGQTGETRSLATQLDQIPRRPAPAGHGKKKKH